MLRLPDGRPIRRQHFGKLWRQLRERAASATVEAAREDGDETRRAAADLAARLELARFHDTRHTYASTLLSGGVSVAAAAEYLGDTPAILLSTYAHLMPGDHDRARSVVEAAFLRGARRAAVNA